MNPDKLGGPSESFLLSAGSACAVVLGYMVFVAYSDSTYTGNDPNKACNKANTWVQDAFEQVIILSPRLNTFQYEDVYMTRYTIP